MLTKIRRFFESDDGATAIVPFTDLDGLDLDGVKWPLVQRQVPLGSTLTLSNLSLGTTTITLHSGYGMAFAYPAADIHV